jgi:Prolyl oligopeptidase family
MNRALIDRDFRRLRRLAARLLITALTLSACGGSGKSVDNATPAAPVRGSLLQDPPALMSTQSVAALLSELNLSVNQTLLLLAGSPLCDVQVYQLRYHTVGGANEATTASGVLMVPDGLDVSCRGARPVVLYAHGTTTQRAFNIANLTDPQNAEGLIIAALFAAQGYIVVAPNYAGFDSSTLAYHPYLNADQQSKDMIDALTAARSALPVLQAPLTKDSGKLFITGYSQGGYVAMATHRAMQAAGMTVTASAPMSGPYALAAFVDAVFEGEVGNGAPVLATLLITAYQHSYGDLYASPAEVFEAPYATDIDSLLPSTLSRSELYAQGKLPRYALFNAVPPDPSFAAISPPLAPANLASVFAAGFGAGNLIRNSYRLSFLLDAQANPDGGWPNTTTGVAATSPGLPFRQALQRNDLRNWVPTAPSLLCGGDADPSVYWLNTQLMQGYWAAHATATTQSTVLDLEAPAPAGDRYASLKAQFAVAKQLVAADAIVQGATDGGAAAVNEAYHATLVPPYCLAAVRSFFTGL